MRVVYEDAFGRRAEGDALDVGAGGVFIRCDQPAPAGKGLSLELVLQDGNARLSVLGRVAWLRAEAAAEGPAGMGVRFLDAEPAVLARIEQLVASRERTEPGTGGAKIPAREPTAHGVGSAQASQAAATPIIAVAPTRERTVLGVGAPAPAPQRMIRRGEPSIGEPPPEEGWESTEEGRAAPEPESPALAERSIPIELVTTRASVEPPAPSEASLVAAGLRRRRSRAWPAVLVVLLAAGCAAYVFRARIPWVQFAIERASELITPSQPVATPPPAPAPAPQPSASTPAPAATPSEAPTASSAPVASASSSAAAAAKSAPGASASAPAASAKPAKRTPPKAPSSQSSANRGADNPY